MTDEELNLTAKELKPLVVSELILFAYWGKTPIAFSVSLPDYYEVLKHLNGKIGLLGAIKFLELVEHSTHTTSFPMSGRVSMRSGLSSAILRSLSHQGSSPAGML